MSADHQPDQPAPDLPAVREGYVPVHNSDLFVREIGVGQPVIVLHGGPDFDQSYLLPELDRLSDSFRLIYYDQRGRGRSGSGVQPEDVSIASEIEDLERLREHFQLYSAAVLGHSWGGLLAMEYAIRHPQRVSHLILMNTAPASQADYMLFRMERRKKWPDDMDKLITLSSTSRYQSGDVAADAEYYYIHFQATVRQPEHLERVVGSLRSINTPVSILKAREIEDRLMSETWLSSEYDLIPKLAKLHIPTLVIYSEFDFVPEECSAHIAGAIPDAHFVLIKDTGHFSFIENPEGVRKEIVEFFYGAEP